MRIELTESRHYPDLRDYFLRLGAVVARGDGEALEVHFADGVLQEDESPEMYFRTWARYNRVDARPVAATPTIREPGAPPANSPQPSGSGAKPPVRLGELLVRKALINDDQLSRALTESRQTGETLGRVLVRHGSVFESDLARVLAEQWSIPYVNLALIGVDRSALSLLPRDVGLRYAAVPVRFVGNELRVAFADPSDAESVAAVQERLSAPIQAAIAELSDIDAVWRTVAA
jgi:hypothetical protein